MQMKIVSLLVFVGAMIGTWHLTRAQGPMSQSVHLGIQNDLKNIIAEYVQKNLPDSKNLRFDRFWTESLKDNRIKATFSYSFESETAESGTAQTGISGYAILNKVNEDPQSITYSLDELHVLDNAVEFEEPIQITTGPGPAVTIDPPPPTEETK
jgi:hypothetical protein